jgi:uncharacterized LabA/DUF88 family protein
MAAEPDKSMNLRFAVLIDADNVPRGSLKGILDEVAIYGTPTIKRIYGDWTNPTVTKWKTSLLENAVTPIQQYSYTTGKNSTDSAMIIDAMDILYSGKVDGFVLVSSDSDFTRLAVRLREAGMKVIGIGEKKTPGAFIVACDKFIYIEVIRQKATETAAQEADAPAVKEEPRQETVKAPEKKTRTRQKSEKVPKNIVKLIGESVADLADDSGFVYMGDLGNLIVKKQPDFDVRNFGFRSLSALIKSLPTFEIDFRQTTDPNIKHPFVRDKNGEQQG